MPAFSSVHHSQHKSCSQREQPFALPPEPELTLPPRSVAQICSRASIPSNLAVCASVIHRAALAGAKLILLPEASDFLAPQLEVARLSTPLDGSEFVDGIRHAARRDGVWVGVGVHEKGGGERCWNSQLVSRARVGG